VRNLTEEKDPKTEQDARAGWLRQRLSELGRLPLMPGVHLSEEIERLQSRLKKLQHESRRHDTWVTVEIARHKERPRTRDYIRLLIDGFEELKGDRLRADDPAIVGGLGWFRGRAVLVVGHQKGRTLDELTQNNFGMANPEGYRKAQRLFKLAERHGLPVLTFVDTPGAYPGVAAEEGGQARAIAETMLRMARLTVPVIATIIGEGGSGGALALAVADRVLMLENATYSVITPEGCAAILWRDADFAPQAAEALRPTASQLLELMAVEKVVEEPRGGAHHNPELAAQRLGEAIASPSSVATRPRWSEPAQLTIVLQDDGAVAAFANLTNGASATVSATANDGSLAWTLPTGTTGLRLAEGAASPVPGRRPRPTCGSASTRTDSSSCTSSSPTARWNRSGSTTRPWRPARPNPEPCHGVWHATGLSDREASAADGRAAFRFG
jgi:acetyl-CoA carboxylase carboxyl transferase subunit alpha